MLRSSFATVVATSVSVLSVSYSQALRVVSPSEGMAVVADKPFEVEWTGADEETRFDIDLYYCGSYSFCFDEDYTVEFEYDNGFGSSVGRFNIDLYESEGSGDCGTWQTSICDKPGIGRKDTHGDYDVSIPASTTGGMFRIRVGLWGDDAVYACSDAFEVFSPGTPPV